MSFFSTRPWLSRATVAMAMVLVVVVVWPVSPAEATGSRAQAIVLRTDGSPFDPDGDGRRERVRIILELADAATVDVRIHDFGGRRLRTLTHDASLAGGQHEWVWNGRDGKGRRVPYGPYRVRATIRTAAGEVARRAAWITRAARVPYAIRPGAVVVALDPGHGGPAGGAAWRGLVEDDVNLDIGLRLRAMLKGAGIGVVMTRRTDRNVSPVGLDLTGDGRYTRTDELIARNDIANQARADIHIAIHNNASVCHCTRGTAMYTHDRRGWSRAGLKLARRVLDEHVRHLRRLPGYRPRKRGVKIYPFKALKPYHRRKMPRPSLQPSILGESLFIDWPSENRILGSRSGRTIVAAGYFDGIARYLAWRPYGLRYEILEAPKATTVGGTVTIRLRLTNRGHATSSSWRISARVVPKVFRYDGRPRRGEVATRIAVPDGLAPGQSVAVSLTGIPMPSKEGKWLVKLDVELPGGDRMSRHGVVGPQLRVRTVAP